MDNNTNNATQDINKQPFPFNTRLYFTAGEDTATTIGDNIVIQKKEGFEIELIGHATFDEKNDIKEVIDNTISAREWTSGEFIDNVKREGLKSTVNKMLQTMEKIEVINTLIHFNIIPIDKIVEFIKTHPSKLQELISKNPKLAGLLNSHLKKNPLYIIVTHLLFYLHFSSIFLRKIRFQTNLILERENSRNLTESFWNNQLKQYKRQINY